MNFKFILKKLFNLTALGGTAFIFFFMWMLSQVSLQVEFFNVLEQVFDDFDLTHIYYSKVRSAQDVPFEDNIVIVNLGTIDRRGIAEQINIINKYKPKVIGIDARFLDQKEDVIGDFQLAQAFKEVDNMVIGSVLLGGNELTKTWDTLVVPPPMFLEHIETGFVNVGNEESGNFIFWGDIPPKDKVKNGRIEPSFAAKVMQLYDKEKADKFLSRENEKELIYFKGNLDKYSHLDVDDVLKENFDPELIEGKIVLIGYLGTSYTNYDFAEDKFYTPLNPNLLGRSTPDMYGVVVHANILSMILEDTYIDTLPRYMTIIIALLFCYINVAIFAQIILNRRLGVWYNAISKLIQLIEAIFVYSVSLFLFGEFNYQVDLSLTLFAIILSGDITEIYIDVILNAFKRFVRKPKIR